MKSRWVWLILRFTKRKWRFWLTALPVVLALSLVAYELQTRVLRGRLAGEAFYGGRPTSYWSPQLRRWHKVFNTRFQLRPLPVPLNWQRWAVHRFPALDACLTEPAPDILDAGPEARAVLLALQDDEHDGVRYWATLVLDDLKLQDARMAQRYEKLSVAVQAFAPVLCQELMTEPDWRFQELSAVLDELHKRHPGLRWAVADADGRGVSVFDSPFEAADQCDLGRQFLAACKVEDGRLSLSVDGSWHRFKAVKAPR